MERLARKPRPNGSRHAKASAQLLAAELGALGLEVHEQRGSRRGRDLLNVMARVRGTDSTGTLLLMAHHDTVPQSPGASDDGLGVVAVLEAMRHLAERTPRNDVLALFTDGEEVGLLGSRLFVEEHPAFGEVRAVLNFEAIGNAGPCVLFESGPKSGALIEAWYAAKVHPVGGSLMQAIYGWMPNNTDYSTFRDAGVPGLNFAIGGASGFYHSPHDLPESLSEVSLWHMSSTAMMVAEGLANQDLRSAEAKGLNVLCLPLGVVLLWPGRWHWLVVGIALCAAWGTAWRHGGLRHLRRWRFVFDTSAFAALSALGFGLCWFLMLLLASGEHPLVYAEIRSLALVSAIVALIFGLAWAQWRCSRRVGAAGSFRVGAASLWSVLVVLFAIVDVETQGAGAPFAWACLGLCAAGYGLARPSSLGGRIRRAWLLALALLPLAPYYGLLVQLACHRPWGGALMGALLVGVTAPLFSLLLVSDPQEG